MIIKRIYFCVLLAFFSGAGFAATDMSGHEADVRDGVLEQGDLVGSDNSLSDRHVFAAEEGDQLQIDVISEDFDTYVRVITPSGEMFSDDDDGDGTNSRVALTVDQAGDCVIKVYGFGPDDVGQYQLRINYPRRGRGRGPLVFDAQLTRHDPMSAGKYYDLYAFEAERGDEIEISVEAEEGLDTYLIVRRPSGSDIEDDDSGDGTNPYLSFVANADGRYEVRVTTYRRGKTGSYVLRMNGVSDVELPRGSSGRDGASNQRRTEARRRVVVGHLRDNDSMLDNKYYDCYRFHADRGEGIEIDLISSDFDTFLRVNTPSDDEMTDDDDGEGTDSQLRFRAAESGEYEVVVTSYRSRETGAYRLEVKGGGELQACPRRDSRSERVRTIRGRLERGDRTLDDGSYYDGHTVRVRRGDEVEINMTSDDFDTYLSVTPPGGDRLTDDDGGDGTNSRITFTAERSGDCEIGANSYTRGETGQYEVTVTIR